MGRIGEVRVRRAKISGEFVEAIVPDECSRRDLEHAVFRVEFLDSRATTRWPSRSRADRRQVCQVHGLTLSGADLCEPQPRRLGAPKRAPVNPPSTINSTALMYDESSEARKSTAFAMSSGSPHRPSGIVEEYRSTSLADCSAETEARGPRFQSGVLVAPGATTLTRMLRGC